MEILVEVFYPLVTEIVVRQVELFDLGVEQQFLLQSAEASEVNLVVLKAQHGQLQAEFIHFLWRLGKVWLTNLFDVRLLAT